MHLIESDFHFQVRMSYIEAQKLHDLRYLRVDERSASLDEVLHLVLAIALDHEAAAECLGHRTDGPVERWPSTLYRVLARAALECPSVWRRCAERLDGRLRVDLGRYADRTAAELAEAFAEGRDALTGYELAALLWCLIRQRCRSHDLVAHRLGLELGVVAAQRLRHAHASY